MWPRRWTALLLCVAVVVCCALPLTVAAAETVTVMSTAINRVGETVDGLTFAMGSPTTSVTTPVSVQGCSITGSGLTFQLSSTALILNATVADATVTDTTIVVTGNPTSHSSIVIRGVTATMTGTTPLVNMKNYVPNTYTTLAIIHISATWTGGGTGGAVVYTGGLAQGFINSALIVHHVHAKNAAHLFIYDAPMCSGTWCFDSTNGLISFAFNYCEDCTGPMINVAAATPLSCGTTGMLRFANNTITGGQPFFSTINDKGLHAGVQDGHVIVSGIYSDGDLFSLPTTGYIAMYGESSITMRHINVRALGIPNNGKTFPNVDGAPKGTSRHVFLGNITENGVRFDETTQQGYTNLNIDYAKTVLVDDMGFIAYNPNQLTGMGGSGTPSPSWAYCQRSLTSSVSTEVLYGDSAVPVLRAMCVCTDSTVYMPYCTLRPDPYAWYDGFNALDTLKVFLVESRAGVASPQTYAGSLQNLCPTYNATLYEPTTVTQQGALELMMSARSVSSNANVYVGAQYAGQTTQDGSWTWTTTDDAFTSKYGLNSDDPSLSAVPSTTAYTNWATANPAMTVAADGTPSARYMAMNSASGGWVNPAAETRTFYAACVAAPPPKTYDITIATRSGTSLSSEALCGENRAPLVVLDADVQAALERKLIETNTDATATVLLGGLYNTDTSAWTWVRDVRDSSTAVSAFGSTNSGTYTDWAQTYPTSSVDTERYIGFSASTGGWVNVASVADASYVACEPMSYTPDTTGLYTVTLPAGWKSATENMALMCYSGGVQGRLMQPTTVAKEAALEYMVSSAANTNANTVGVFGLFYSDGTWSWVSTPQYYPDGATPLNAGSDFTNWASGYPQSSVASGAVAGFSAAAGGWIDVDPSTVTNWVAVCEPLPADEPADDAMNKIFKASSAPSVPLAGANAMMQACAATNMNPVLTLTSAAAERALKRRLLLDGVDTTSTTVVVGGYFTDTSLQSGDWVWINSWDDSQPTAFTNHYALTSQPAATTVAGAYTNWAPSYPTSSLSSSAGRFVAFDAQQDGWINTNAATVPLYVACETYDMTAAEAADMLFIAKVNGAQDIQLPSIYRGNLDNLCPAYNGTLYEPNSVLKQRALTLVRSAQGVSSTTAVFVGGEYSGKTQTDGTWNWASSGAFMQNYAVTGSAGTAAALEDRYNNWRSSYPSGTLPTNNQPGQRFVALYQNGWYNPTSTTDTSVVAACAPGPTPYNYGIRSVVNPKNTFSPTLMCGGGYTLAIVPNASVQAAIERVILSSGQTPELARMISIRYNVTTGRYVWLQDLRDPATAVSSFVPGDTSDGSYQNWAPLIGVPASRKTNQYAGTRSVEGGWIYASSYAVPTYLACQPYTLPADEQTDTLFIVKAPAGMAAPQTYAGGLENLCRAYNATLYEPSTAYRQDALETEMNTMIAAGMANTADVYIGARYYGDTETGGVWAYESSNGTTTGVFTDNFATGAVVLTNRITSWVTGYPAGSLTTDGTPGPRFVASRRDLKGWVNPTTETTDFYAACYTSTPPEEFDITLEPRFGSATDSYSLCGFGRAPLLVLNASVQAALERKLIRDGVATSATVLLGGLYNTDTSAWTWVRDLRDFSTAVSTFGSTNSSAYTDWALNYPTTSVDTERYIGFSASTGGWVNVASVSDASYVACEPYMSPLDQEASKVFLVESRAGVASPQTYADSLQLLCPAFNGTLYELTAALKQDALERVMNMRSVPSDANVYIGAQYAGQTTQDGSWAWTTTGDAFTSKYGLSSDDPSLSAVPSTTAYTNWATANPAMTVAADGTPSARYMAMNSASGGWVNPAAETRTFYAACVAAPPPKTYDITIATRSGTSLSSEALCGENRAPLVVLDADVQAALERKLIETNTDATATVLLGGLYNTNNSAWTWMRDLRDSSTTVSLFGSANSSAYTDWAQTYPTFSVDTERYIGFSASTGGWVNVASVSDASYVACEPYASPVAAEASKVFLVESRTGVASPQTYTDSLRHLCPASNGTLYAPAAPFKQDALERVMNMRGVPSDANVYVGAQYAGQTTQDGSWTWTTTSKAFTNKYGLSSDDPSLSAVPSTTAYTNWATANPAMTVAADGTPSARYMAMNSASGGWVNPAAETRTFYAACVAAPPPKTYDITIATRSGTSLSSEALCGENRAPLVVLDADVQAALERKLIETNTDATATVLLGGLYNADNSAWTWLRDMTNESSALSAFGSANSSAYGHWAPTYPTTSVDAERYIGFSASTGGWVNVASVSDAAYVACEPHGSDSGASVPRDPKDKAFLWWPILVAILGALLIAFIIIILCCCCRRRKPTELHASEYVDTVTPPRVRPPVNEEHQDATDKKAVEMVEVGDETDVQVFSARPSLVSGNINPLALPADANSADQQPRGPRRRARVKRGNGPDVADVDLDFMTDANTAMEDDFVASLRPSRE